ncbi:NUDIX hydrolase [Rhizorhapis suberifaciens]|uniref:8-oxo-dGTP pyrophosphatase MutT (NUDIX family) n=1 Tax=Rhizorhapis suberifaciens TaxID=13656 RepID=A0A840HR92_9SPHN|nr:NUDIX domain-containing protein [Rhizorhapis suberifaciens]MBB4640130.1 8-oxo-dGTP pyrophosphatase MutT (NUDIX family) [Rhizorhapis suberifaciens]
MTAKDIPPARPAATLVIFREREGQCAELLMMERAGTMDFAAGALVFPGGAVDVGDESPARMFAPDLEFDEATARVAAVRETLEECGLALGFAAPVEMALAKEMRERLAAGEAFGSLLDEYGLSLDLDQLVPFARWLPNLRRSRIYDTRFYLARLPNDSHAAVVDATENIRLFWASASEVIDRANRGEVHLIFPTRRNLERLAQFKDFDSASAHARSIAIRIVTPWMEEREGRQHLCIPEDLGYPVTSEPADIAVRG